MAYRPVTTWEQGYIPNQNVNAGSEVDFSTVTTRTLQIGESGGPLQYTLPGTVAAAPGYALVASATAGETEWGPAANPFDQDLNTSDAPLFDGLSIRGNYSLPVDPPGLNQVIQQTVAGMEWVDPPNPFDQDLNMVDEVEFKTVSGDTVEAKQAFFLGPVGATRCSFPMDVSASDNGDLLTYNGAGAAEWRAPPRETLWLARGPFTVAASPPPSAPGDLLTGGPSLVVQHGTINLPQTLLSSNLGAQYTLKLSGWLTTTNVADKFNISFAMQKPGATFPIVTSKIDFNVLAPAVDIPWESEVRFSVSTASASELLVEGAGCFTYRGDENTSSNHALEGNVLGFPAPADRTAGGVVVALSPPFNINVTLLYNVWYDDVDVGATVTINKGSLVLDRYV
jgi:hypothetical protein